MANKKINQLVSKTAILSTDLFGIGDATTGQLFKKTIAELQAAIGGAVISVNGLVGTVVLDTDDIQELATPTNKYFTDARARGAISLTVTGNSGASTYSSGTGVLNVPTYTLAGLGGITASFLSGTSGISYNSSTGVISYSGTVYTDSSIRALLSGGTGISYNSSTGAISYSGTVYTDSSVRALISLTTTGTSGASTYNNTTGVINVPDYTLAGLGGISLTSLSGGTGITYNSSTGAISYSGTVYTDASVRALISASGAVSYNNTTGVISLTSGNLTEATSSVLTITGGTGAVLGSGTSIQVKQATTSVSGFLSSTDWNTFNGKANALSGTTNYVAKFTSSSGIGNSAITDDGTTVTLISRALTGTTATFRVSDNRNLAIKYDTNITLSGQSDSGAPENLRIYADTFKIFTSTTTVGLTERLTISNTGNVGIGITAPVSKLQIVMDAIYSNSDLTGLSISNATTILKRLDLGYDGTADISYIQSIHKGTAYKNLALNPNGGNVGIGSSTPSEKLEVQGGYLNIYQADGTNGAGFALRFSTDGGGSKNIIGEIGIFNVGTARSGNMYFQTSNAGAPSTRMTITYTGNILMGTTSDNGERLYISGNVRATGTITANSDLTLKKNLLKIENALEKVEQINGYTYEFKEDDSKRHAGVIAQEIQTVLPEIVNKGNDGILGVEYGNISALLIEAIKEQQTQIKELKALLNK